MEQHNNTTGDWRHLDAPLDHPRYAFIAGLLQQYCVGGSLLDVGCGPALLRNWLPTEVRYTGIDLSAEAVQIARARDASLKIHHTSAERYDAHGDRFDCIVFNEVLYYVTDPIRLLRRYASMLKPGGVMLCSVYLKPGTAPLTHRLWHWLTGRRPYSNVRCAELVRAFMKAEAWPILDDCVVPLPGAAAGWQIWLASPPRHSEAGNLSVPVHFGVRASLQSANRRRAVRPA